MLGVSQRTKDRMNIIYKFLDLCLDVNDNFSRPKQRNCKKFQGNWKDSSWLRSGLWVSGPLSCWCGGWWIGDGSTTQRVFHSDRDQRKYGAGRLWEGEAQLNMERIQKAVHWLVQVCKIPGWHAFIEMYSTKKGSMLGGGGKGAEHAALIKERQEKSGWLPPINTFSFIKRSHLCPVLIMCPSSSSTELQALLSVNKRGQRSFSGYVCSAVPIGFGAEILQVQINTTATGAGEINGWSEDGYSLHPPEWTTTSLRFRVSLLWDC